MKRTTIITGIVTLAMGFGAGLGTGKWWQANVPTTDAANAVDATDEKREIPECSPGYSIDKPLVDFGKMREGQAFSEVVEFTHPGTGEIRIGSIKTTCPCLSVRASKMIIPAGEKGKLRLDLHSLTAHGNRKWEYYVEILKPEKAMIVGRVDARIKRVPAGVMLDTGTLHFGTLSKPKTTTFKLYNLTKQAIRVKVADAAGLIVLPIAKGGTVAGGSNVEIKVIADPAKFVGKPLHGKLKLTTSLPLHSVIEIPFDGNVRK